MREVKQACVRTLQQPGFTTLLWKGSFLADENVPSFKGFLLFSISREHRLARLGRGVKNQTLYNTKGIPPRHINAANPRPPETGGKRG